EPYATAALLDTSPAQAGQLLGELEQVNLLDQPTPGRYRFHDLIRAYATTLDHTRPAADRRAPPNPPFDHYTPTHTHATTPADPSTRAPPRTSPSPPAPPPQPRQAPPPAPHLPDPAAATAWLEAEQTNLLVAAAHATALRPEHTTHQSATLHRHLYLRGHYTD